MRQGVGKIYSNTDTGAREQGIQKQSEDNGREEEYIVM